MRKHFFSEENAIFNAAPLKIIGVVDVIDQLKKEHVIMLKDLEDFAKDIQNIGGEKMESFHNFLENHRKIEEMTLYPKLDSALQPMQKKELIERVNEIPIKNK